MNIFSGISDFIPNKKTVATLGTFDGVHIGHMQIIERLLANAEELDCESVILTFFPHPRMVLQDGSDIKLLNTIDERAALLSKTGLDNLIVHPFDKTFSQLSAEEFVKTVLVDGLNIKKIIIGHDHRFGRNRSADFDDLVRFGKQFDFEVEQISAQEINDVAVSSTKIRNALLEGDVAVANQYLGYEYILTAEVVYGQQLGRTIGFPTANLSIPETYKLLPANGVYIVRSIIDGQLVYGMMNIGTKPTIDGKTLSTEVYFLDFSADLYGKTIAVSVLHRIRDEQKFASVELLKQQLNIDEQATRNFVNSLNDVR